MPYALKQKTTAELFSCTLINIYDFPYHGVKVWEERETAERDYASFLAEQGSDEPWLWEVVELSEDQNKMCNVKLNNNPAKRVYLGEQGRIEARIDT